MELGISHAQSQRLLKQRNMLAIVGAVLFCLVMMLTVLASSRDREVVLQPILSKPLTLSSDNVSGEYLTMVTRDAALLTLNRSPENLQYWMDSILELADPQTHGKLKAQLMKLVEEQSGSNISQYFTISKLTVDPASLTSEVNGIMHTVVGSKEVTAEARTFKYVWTYSGLSLKLAGFGLAKPKVGEEDKS